MQSVNSSGFHMHLSIHQEIILEFRMHCELESKKNSDKCENRTQEMLEHSKVLDVGCDNKFHSSEKLYLFYSQNTYNNYSICNLYLSYYNLH